MQSKNNVLEIEILRQINCSQEVAKWNYWDHEHLDVVHGGYKSVDILYDKDNFCFGYSTVKIPVFSFLNIKTPLFLVQHDKDTQYTYAIQFGVISRTRITIKPNGENKCKLKMNYQFHLNGWKIILKPILKKLVPIWNKKVWQEDLPLKLRRQKVLNMGFKDFHGMPDSIDIRNNEHKIKETILPVPRPRGSSRDRHPLSKNLNLKK